jgi:mannose-6-phosphate isomerase-like protein (cupin superfamily)
MKVRKLHVEKKTWGEERIAVDPAADYGGKLLVVKRQHRSSVHHHKKKRETFLFLSGKVYFEVDGEGRLMEEGDVLELDVNERHRFTGIQDAVVAEFSTHDDPDDSYRDSTSERMADDEFAELLASIGED